MFEWFFAPYSKLLWGMESLLVIPGLCGAPVDVARALTLLLCVAAAARIAASCIADRRLRRRCPVYGPGEFSGLYDLYREAGARVGLRRLPPLHRQAEEGPLAFTTGCFRPAVFLAPVVIRSLGTDELCAVLVHELVHVRQRDNLRAWLGSLPVGALVVVLQAAALYVMFFRMELPFGFAQAGMLAAAVLALLWTFRSVVWPRVVFRRELSCDDRVVEAVRDPLVVAASLVQVWRLQRALPRRPGALWLHAHPLLRTRPSVEQRIRRLMDHRPAPRRAWPTLARRALATTALLWMVMFLWTYHRSERGAELRAQLRETAPELIPTRR
ncbi:M48 family metalloprotease [Longimicrobium sp.]|uniref:M48 family metalloprotease n=1 Tax=Longimicrobium sp. TaxID=2029185 RepID=UPI002E323BD2|nr:M48 family metalloprotease [Longimicrobium sp.]HEX6036446.1 M48 family metalloprotease [Longimicrobium sp.]